MTSSPHHLIWIDLEMTGLDPAKDRIIEIATIITDSHLNIIELGPELVVFQPDEVLNAMDEWNTKHHTRSGLVKKVKSSLMDEKAAEAQTLAFISRFVPPKKSPMCGNSICQDRRFLCNYMPALENHFHYRNLDVSTVKELGKHWAPHIVKQFKKKSKHLAMEDIKESIAELRHYRDTFFKLGKEN